MIDPKLLEVGVRLEKAVEHLATVRPSEDRLQLAEQIAISMLDSEHSDFEEGVLEAYLMDYLQQLTQ
tara:strand:- start:2662 stop:2862 length:201 start_codon:yes stop_codon:yes gene_type:complete